MTIQDAHTDDYPRDVDIDLMSPEQPPTRFKYSDEETLEWARGLGEIPQGHSKMEADAKLLTDTSWQLNRLRRCMKAEGGLRQAGEDYYIEILKHSRALDELIENYMNT